MKQKRCSLNNSAGFTLIELLIVMAIFMIVVGAMYGVYESSNRSHAIQNEVVDAQNNLRAAVGLLTRELRMAGYQRTSAFQSVPETNPVNLPTSPVVGNRLVVFIDLDSIEYYLDDDGNIRRNNQVIAENISDFVFDFTDITNGRVTFNVTADTARGDRDRSATVTVQVRNM